MLTATGANKDYATRVRRIVTGKEGIKYLAKLRHP
jgi:hypothetical protein